MYTREFTPKIEPSGTPHNFKPASSVAFIFHDSLKPETRAAIAAVFQILLCSILPLRWAVVPALILLGNSIITTIYQIFAARPNPYQKNVVTGMSTAQLPDEMGHYGPAPADKPFVLFNLGIQYNHPMGVFSPGSKEIGAYFGAMQRDLHNRRDELGLLNMSQWRGNDRESNNTLNMTFFFKDVESIHKFAHEKIHREAWDFHHKGKFPHIGLYHETFCVDRNAYENLYLNCSPVGMGRGTVKVRDKEGEGEWRNTLVDSKIPALKSQYARMNRGADGTIKM